MTLFTFGRSIQCECGAWVDMAVGHQQTSEGAKRPMMPQPANERREEEAKLLAAIEDALPRLEKLWEQANSHRGYEDPVYRFYHQSMKVYFVQSQTDKIVKALQDLAPHLPLNPWFQQIVDDGVPEQFSPEINERWLEATRPRSRILLPRPLLPGDDLQVRQGTEGTARLIAERLGGGVVLVWVALTTGRMSDRP